MGDLTWREPGRECVRRGIDEERELRYGMDFRLPQYRREVFLRSYEFHLKYRNLPGCIYFVFPHLAQHYGWSREDRYWFAYLNGATQNPVTTWLIWRDWPSVQSLDVERFARWFERGGERYSRLEFDTDRRYFKKELVPMVADYKRRLAGKSQADYWEGEVACTADARENFRRAWDVVRRDFIFLGRLSAFSYLEYLRVMGVPLDCDQLFLRDLDGSKSHRNGLCKVLGRDDLDWHPKTNPTFSGEYTEPVLKWLVEEGEVLLDEAQRRFGSVASWAKETGYFTLESTLCNYKSWHRPNRRYPNVYADMFHDRIRRAESRWGDQFEVFWAARRASLPKHLRLEDCPEDKGVHPDKQNHYLRTGQPIMMHREWPEFQNDYNDSLEGSTEGVLALL